MLGRLNEDGRAGEKGGDDRGKGVVEGVAVGRCQFDVFLPQRLGRDNGVLPAHTCGENTQWLPSYFVMLVHHQEIRWPSFRSQSLLAVLDRPFQFLDGDQNLSQHSIDLGLARIQACYRCDVFLIVQNEPTRRRPTSTCPSRSEGAAILITTYFNIVLKTFRLCLNVVVAHSLCASAALATALSMPSGVAGLTWLSSWPVAGL